MVPFCLPMGGAEIEERGGQSGSKCGEGLLSYLGPHSGLSPLPSTYHGDELPRKAVSVLRRESLLWSLPSLASGS